MDYSASTATQISLPSLSEAISQLEEVSGQLNSLIFGERPEKQEPRPIAGDKLTQARNRIQEITVRLREVKDRLTIIGD